MSRWTVVGAVSLALAVGLGAFGTHALRGSLSEAQLGWWATAQQYQAWHGLGLVLLGLLEGTGRRVTLSGWMLVVGTLVFSGTLYAMALGGPRWLGAVTPVGGASFIAGWLALAVTSGRKDG